MKVKVSVLLVGLLVFALAVNAFALNFRETKVLADQGHADAQYNLGLMYYRGEGIDRDLKEAAKWYELAAQQGHPRAQINLGIMYFKGEGVEEDKVKAAEWIGKAAEQGYAEAQYGLGNMYFYGQGVPKSQQEAELWYHRAASQGHERAKNALAYIRSLDEEKPAPSPASDKPADDPSIKEERVD